HRYPSAPPRVNQIPLRYPSSMCYPATFYHYSTQHALGKYTVLCGNHSYDPVDAPVLTHQLSNDICNITLTCRGHDLSINSSCYNGTCEEKNETSPGGVALSLSVRGSSIICNHSNPVSWKNKTLEMGELTRSCTDGGEHSAQDSTGVVVSIVVPVAVVTIISIFISVYIIRRRSPGVSEEQLYSSVPGVSGNTQREGTDYAAVETTGLSDPSRS
ncbi:hypothetical protein NFI96_031631, partial [Prochilodus magdalenae]